MQLLSDARLSALVDEADELFGQDPDSFDPPTYNQPSGWAVSEAAGLLGDAPWHRVGHVAHALDKLDEE